MGKPGGYYNPPAIAGGTDLITQGSRLKAVVLRCVEEKSGVKPPHSKTKDEGGGMRD